MTEPQRALIKTGATLRTISTETGLVNGWHGISDEALVDDITVPALGQDQLNEFVEAVVTLFTELGSVRKAA